MLPSICQPAELEVVGHNAGLACLTALTLTQPFSTLCWKHLVPANFRGQVPSSLDALES